MNDHLESMNDIILDVTHLDITEEHPNLVNSLKQVGNSKPIVLDYNGEQVAALISIEDLHLLERLIEEEEDRLDIADTEKILAETKESDWIPFEQVKAEMGM